MSEITVLYEGYSIMDGNEDQMSANCSCTLIKGTHNVIVDTMTAWDRDKILHCMCDKTGMLYDFDLKFIRAFTILALQKHNITPGEINYVVSTHGHSDHIGNNNLFLNAKHIVGFSVSYVDKYFMHPFDKGEEFIINNSVKVIPTPGHTLSDVTVLATTSQGEKVAITGDLFEKYEDIEDPKIWLEAGSEDPFKQSKNRLKIINVADWIVPGHGKRFQVTPEIRKTLLNQSGEFTCK